MNSIAFLTMVLFMMLIVTIQSQQILSKILKNNNRSRTKIAYNKMPFKAEIKKNVITSLVNSNPGKAAKLASYKSNVSKLTELKSPETKPDLLSSTTTATSDIFLITSTDGITSLAPANTTAGPLATRNGTLPFPARFGVEMENASSPLSGENPDGDIQVLQELKQLHIERIKEHILRKLHMTAPPNVSNSRTLPAMLLRKHLLRDSPPSKKKGDSYAKPREVILFGTRVGSRKQQSPSFRFDLNIDSKIRTADISEVKLYIYKNYNPRASTNQTCRVTEELRQQADDVPKNNFWFLKRREPPRKSLDMQHTSLKRGWIKFDIKDTLIDELQSNAKSKILKVSCISWSDPVGIRVVSHGRYSPFILITLGQSGRRAKRSVVDCHPGLQTCCRQELTVDFRLIGWTWIISPRRYVANFCMGTCNLDRSNNQQVINNSNLHTTLLTEMSQRHSNQELRSHMGSCCVPKEMSAISILHWVTSTRVDKVDVSDMTVDSCLCAV